MQKIIISLTQYNTYDVIEWSARPIGMLGLFLTDMFMFRIQSYIEWAIDPKKEYLEGNRTCLIKKDSIILIGSLFSDDADGGPFFEISIPTFVKLLAEWKKLFKEKRQKITITQLDDGTMTIEGESTKIIRESKSKIII